MTTVVVLVVLAVLFLAYSNGGNDNFKGVATLFGSGTCGYRQALIWATGTTLAGSLLALYLAAGLVHSFSGKELVPDAVIGQPAFLLAVSLGAALTVLLATWLGLPVSTTHALTGGLVRAGLLATEGNVALDRLGASFVLPLLGSPVVALGLTVLLYPALRKARRAGGVTSQTCVCIGTEYEEVSCQPGGALLLVRTGARLEVGEAAVCVERYRGQELGLSAGKLLDGLHDLSGGAVGFARGLNDTPKIVALLMVGEAGSAIHPNAGLASVALIMAVGGMVAARRVAETMSKKIAHELGAGADGQPRDGFSGVGREPPRLAGLHHSRLGRLAVRDRRGERHGPRQDDPEHPARVGDDPAARGRAGRDGLRAVLGAVGWRMSPMASRSKASGRT